MGARMRGCRSGSLRCVGALALLAAGPLLAALAASCSLLDLRTFSVVSWSPREKRLTSLSEVVVEIRFSKEANRSLTERAFSITGDDARLSGRFSWPDSRTLRFTPAEPLSDFVVYLMRLSTEAEDTLGNDLCAPFAHTFTTKDDVERPSVLSVLPPDHGRIADPLLPISITFSEAMNPATLFPAFSLSPPAVGFLSLSSDGSVLTFTPSEQLAWQSEYVVCIAKEAGDRQRNTLGAAFTARFLVGTDTTRPSVVSVACLDASIVLLPDDPADSRLTVSEGWESNASLVVRFSEPVLTRSALAAIGISPRVGQTIREANASSTSILTYDFPDRLAYGTTYTLTVAPGIQDVQGSRTLDERAYHFLVNGPATLPPTIEAICFPSSPAEPTTNLALSDYGVIDLSAFPPGERIDTFFDIYLNLAAGASLDPFAVADAFEVTTTNDAAEILPFAVQVNPSAPAPSPPPSDNLNLVVARIWVHLTNNAASGQIELRLSRSLKDSRGTPLARELVVPLNDTH